MYLCAACRVEAFVMHVKNGNDDGKNKVRKPFILDTEGTSNTQQTLSTAFFLTWHKWIWLLLILSRSPSASFSVLLFIYYTLLHKHKLIYTHAFEFNWSTSEKGPFIPALYTQLNANEKTLKPHRNSVVFLSLSCNVFLGKRIVDFTNIHMYIFSHELASHAFLLIDCCCCCCSALHKYVQPHTYILQQLTSYMKYLYHQTIEVYGRDIECDNGKERDWIVWDGYASVGKKKH